ncbi:MAG: glutamate-cysteine ligase family protein, partial [Longimicrobiales bacterium]
FALPNGGAITLEPGGQVEYATPPHDAPVALLRDLGRVVPPLVDAAAGGGIALVGRGIDPFNALADVPLQLDAPRYRMMDEYFATTGSAGARMMRQTASVQLNVDPAGDVETTWRVLNAAAPYLTALFANSSRYAGEDSGFASARAMTWRSVDPQRTGVLPCTGDIADEYAGFALWAPAMFLRTDDGGYLPICEWLRRGNATAETLATHLTTLFPEVRPKGYFEVRCIDARPAGQYAAPVLVVAGLTRDPAALAEAAALLGPPDPALLDRAARLGLRDPSIARTAAALYDLALDGCARLGVDACGEPELDAARAFLAERLAGS